MLQPQWWGFTDPRWMTANQAKKAGGHVRKGSKAKVAIFWKWLEKVDNETGEKDRFPMLRYFNIFNVEEIEGVDLPELSKPETFGHTPIEAAERVVADWDGKPAIAHNDGNRCLYNPARDRIEMVRPERFEDEAEYYSTLFHELTHSTGHESRLNRDLSGRFGSPDYAREELVAEMGAAFLRAETGINPDSLMETSAAYLNNWLGALKRDSKLVVHAAGRAQKAADLILGRAFDAEKSEAA